MSSCPWKEVKLDSVSSVFMLLGRVSRLSQLDVDCIASPWSFPDVIPANFHGLPPLEEIDFVHDPADFKLTLLSCPRVIWTLWWTSP